MSLSMPVHVYAAATAKISVMVLDEEGQSIKNADVKVHFTSGEYTLEGKTDNQGTISLTGYSGEGRIGGEINKNGYYYSTFHYDYHPFSKKFGRWEPWDKHITVVLRPIGNPVPMYVRNRWFSVPMLGQEIGFDLMKADWVIPYGQGVTPDFIVRTEREINGEEIDATLTITFSNKHDGIQVIKEDHGIFDLGSWYRLPRTAPEDGYQSEFTGRRYRGPKGYVRGDDTNNFIFRVRTEVDENGRIIKALYGKIRGDIEFAPLEDHAGSFRMHYYINPDGTRNLEFDPERNLFPKGRGEAQP
jgi:hypothetical protein